MGQIVNPVSLEKGLRAEFLKAFESPETGKIMSGVMKVSSSAASEKFGWLGSVPQMQEFKDEKAPKGLLDHDFTITNVPYEATLKVDKFTLRNDQLGATQLRVRDLAARAKTFPIKLVMDLLAAGESGLCYDGQAFFSASHSEGDSGTQSNLYTGTGATLAQVSADFKGARAAMLAYKDDQGQPMFEEVSSMDLLIVCGPALQGVMEEMLTAAQAVSGVTNVLKGAAEITVSSRLTGNDWYILNRSGVVKPLVFQENMPIEFGALEGDSESGFMRRFYHYGVEWYGNVGYGLWQKAIKVNNA